MQDIEKISFLVRSWHALLTPTLQIASLMQDPHARSKANHYNSTDQFKVAKDYAKPFLSSTNTTFYYFHLQTRTLSWVITHSKSNCYRRLTRSISYWFETKHFITHSHCNNIYIHFYELHQHQKSEIPKQQHNNILFMPEDLQRDLEEDAHA